MSNVPSTEVKSLKDIVSEKIRQQFASLIPDDTWNKMVGDEIDTFMNGKPARGYESAVDSEFKKMIQAEIKRLGAEAIKTELAKPEWQTKYIDGKSMASEAVTKLIVDNANTIVAGLLSSMVQGIVSQVLYNAQQQASTGGMRTY